MAQDLYSVEQVADFLGLHVRTIRTYVREGRLKAVRIGKQYRIAREDLEAFTGRPVPVAEPVRRQRHIEVSSVVQIDAISPDDANRVTNLLLASTKNGSADGQPLRVDSIYDEERGRLKVIVSGSVGTSVGLLKLITLFTESDK
jgi:excisionase family DNA binding protein